VGQPTAEPGNGAPLGPERCSGCGSTALTRLPMVLTDGTGVVFLSCQRCERKEWFAPDDTDGGWRPIPIASVLERSTRRR
jgi:hypothetical protein